MSSQDFFSAHPVFTREDYAHSRPGSSPRTIDSLLRKHTQRGRIARVRRGLYAAAPGGGLATAADPYAIASKAAPDAAISHHAALQFHGRTYSVWNEVTFLTHTHTRAFSFGPVSYVPVRPPKVLAQQPDLGGLIQVLPSGGSYVRVCTRERAAVDLFHTPSLGGGWEEIWRSVRMIEYLDLDALIDHALRLQSATTVARLGVFLTQHRDQFFVEDTHMRRLAQHVSASPHYFDAARTPGRLVHPWNLIVPVELLEQRWGEVS